MEEVVEKAQKQGKFHVEQHKWWRRIGVVLRGRM